MARRGDHGVRLTLMVVALGWPRARRRASCAALAADERADTVGDASSPLPTPTTRSMADHGDGRRPDTPDGLGPTSGPRAAQLCPQFMSLGSPYVCNAGRHRIADVILGGDGDLAQRVMRGHHRGGRLSTTGVDVMGLSGRAERGQPARRGQLARRPRVTGRRAGDRKATPLNGTGPSRRTSG